MTGDLSDEEIDASLALSDALAESPVDCATQVLIWIAGKKAAR